MKLLLIGALVALVLVGGAWQFGDSFAPREDPVDRTPRTQTLVAFDSSGQGHDGVNQGSPSLGVPGWRDTAYSFDQPNSWIQIPSSPELNPGERDFLVSAWVNFTVPPSANETYDIIRKGLSYTVSGEFKLEIFPGGAVKCSAKDSTGYEVSITGGTIDVANGKWHKVACARTGSSWSVIVDGSLRSKASSLGSVGNTMPIALGSKYGLEDAPQGRVDEVRFVIADDTGSRLAPKARIRQLVSSDPDGLWHLDEKPPA